MHLDPGRILEPHDRIGVEIALLDAAVPDGDLVVERGREAVDHAALELHFDRARIDDMAAVDRDRHPLDLHLALLVDRHLGDHAHDAVVAFVNREAAALAGRQRLAPVALLGERVEHVHEVGPLGQQLAAEPIGVLSRRQRQLVDEALHEEGVLRMAGRAPRPKRHMGVLDDGSDPQVGDLIAGARQPLGGLRIEPVPDVDGIGGAAGGAAIEGERQPIGAEAGLEADRGLRAVAALAHVLLARPDQLHGLADQLADVHRLHQFIVAQPAAEAAAREGVVDMDVRRLHAGRLGGELERAVGVLGADPDIDAAALHPGGAVERLHRGVRHMGHLVIRLDHPAGLRHGGIDVAVVARHHAGLIERHEIALAKRGAVGRGVGPEIPFDGQPRERRLGAPVTVRDHGDRIGQLHHLQHAARARDRLLVHASELAAEHRASHDRGLHGAWNLDVDAVDGGAVDLQRRIKTRQRFAHQPVLVGRLDPGLLVERDAGCFRGQLAIAKRAPGDLVQHLALRG